MSKLKLILKKIKENKKILYTCILILGIIYSCIFYRMQENVLPSMGKWCKEKMKGEDSEKKDDDKKQGTLTSDEEKYDLKSQLTDDERKEPILYANDNEVEIDAKNYAQDKCIILNIKLKNEKRDGKRITGITIPDEIEGRSVTIIGKKAFSDVRGLRGVVFPKKLERIYQNALSNHENLEEVKFNDRLERIDEEAFANCISLKEVKFPSSILYLGERAFIDCGKLQKVYFADVEENEKEKNDNKEKLHIYDLAFESCESLSEVRLSNTVYLIGNGVFAKNLELKELFIPSSVRVMSCIFDNKNSSAVKECNCIVKFESEQQDEKSNILTEFNKNNKGEVLYNQTR